MILYSQTYRKQYSQEVKSDSQVPLFFGIGKPVSERQKMIITRNRNIVHSWVISQESEILWDAVLEELFT